MRAGGAGPCGARGAAGSGQHPAGKVVQPGSRGLCDLGKRPYTFSSQMTSLCFLVVSCWNTGLGISHLIWLQIRARLCRGGNGVSSHN